ncbi:S-adenosylmethionine transporter [Lunasporangiospora selenospora]|uniref:S-adenosylmethionine transporter n=1 Tax=Lunasporangiospora selenospora TaxID=979761 RepID=A0A9P6FPK4_9FUNG|nr:S-adenosylmethionine transporter [Lunasporangiospora selenospora]
MQQQQQNLPYTHTAAKVAVAAAHSYTPSVVRKPAYSQSQKFKNHFQSGAVSLSLSYAVMHPLDTLKTRMQVPGGSGIAWSAVFTRETLRLLGKGFVVSSIGAGLQGGARFSFYELTKSYLLPPTSRFQTGLNPPVHPWWLPTLSPIPATAISAIIGDLASSVIKVPREVITSRLQTGYYHSASANPTGAPINAGFVFRAVLREEGVRGLFRGFWSTTARDCPFMVILFTTYENFKAYHTRSLQTQITSDPKYVASSPVEVKIPAMTSTLFGGISGFLAGYFTTPMDVIRTRIMTYKKQTSVGTGAAVRAAAQAEEITMTSITRAMYQQAMQQASSVGSGASNNGFVRTLTQGRNIYSTFFAGAIPRSLWWFCVCSIFFSTYEAMKQKLMPLDYEPSSSSSSVVVPK